MKTKVYIAGKVTGLPFKQVKTKFQLAQAILERHGYEAVNPLEVVSNPRSPWIPAMKKCIKALVDCDAVFVLGEVADSKGAKIEMQLATQLSLPLFVSIESLRAYFPTQKKTGYAPE